VTRSLKLRGSRLFDTCRSFCLLLFEMDVLVIDCAAISWGVV
jgi:hypothetical protein